MSESDTDDESQVDGIDRRQLLLVSLCLVGLVVAAFLAPPPLHPSVSAGDGGESPPNQQDQQDGGSGEPSDAGADSEQSDAARTPEDESAGGSDGSGSGNVLDGDGDPVPVPGDDAPPSEDGCGVVVEEKPVPGTTITVSVYDNRVPVTGARVWFNGNAIGTTDEDGRVNGPVPYNRTLSVAVAGDLESECEFYRRPYRSRAAVDVPDSASLLPTVELGRFRETPENSTGNYTVYGGVNVSVRGDPYPGSTVTVRAAIDGVPMRGATVTSDGERVGATDSDGRYRLTVPEKQEIALDVSRGDFSGERTLDVLLLDASIAPQEGLPIPGERAHVNATVDGSPTSGAEVTLAGRRIGSTTSAGVVAFELPANPTATVTVRTSRQTTGVPVWRVYAPTAGITLALLGLALVTTVAAYRRSGVSRARRVAAGWAVLCLTFAAIVVGEATGLGVALAGLAVVGLYRHRTGVRSRGERTVGLFAGFLRRCHQFVLRVTVELERLIDRLGAVLHSVRAWVGSLTPRVLLIRLKAFPGRIRTGIWLYLTVRRVGAAMLVLGELAAATGRWQVRGFVASLVGLACLGLLLALWRRRGNEPGPADLDRPTAAPAATGESVDTQSTVVSLRGLWRRFARWVVPGTWRTRTPGEVSRAAVARGFPREPVEALTEAFRDVEYGAASADSRRERAKAAYDALVAARQNEEEEQ